MVLIVLIEEGVAVALEKRLVDVHAIAIDTENGLGHEGGIYSVF
ncbi:hypothetical protein ES708_33902 [subsurface metagenome]